MYCISLSLSLSVYIRKQRKLLRNLMRPGKRNFGEQRPFGWKGELHSTAYDLEIQYGVDRETSHILLGRMTNPDVIAASGSWP